MDITEQFDRKTVAVRSYASQFGTAEGQKSIYQPGINIFDLMEVEARQLGRLIQKKYAEAYVIKEQIEIDDPLKMSVPSI